MKILTITSIMIIAAIVKTSAQSITFPYDIDFKQLKENAGGFITSDSELKDNTKYFILTVSNVDKNQKKELLDSYIKLEGQDNEKLSAILGGDESKYYDSQKKTFKIDLTTLIREFKFESNANKTTLSIRDKNNKNILLSFTIEKIGDKEKLQSLSKTQIQGEIQRYFEAEIYGENSTNNIYNVKLKRNTLVDDKGVIHLFLDAYGKFYGPGIPTAATQEDFFQFHILLTEDQTKKNEFEIKYTGEYKPSLLNILKTSGQNTAVAAGGTKNKAEDSSIIIIPWDGDVKGPYTSKFSAEITRKEGNENTPIVNSNIRIAELYHVSISTGLLFTSLKNPQNIETATLPSGETTLIADDPRDRGVLTITATYFPWGRNFLFPPSGGPFDRSRFGIQVGTKLGDDIAENFFLGLSHDFARGGAFTYGIHYGRRNYVAGASDFDFGKDIFDLPELKVKKEWAIGVYVGVVIDTRIAIELIKSIGANP